MSSTYSPKKVYSFDRWKKIDLLDLADRLNLYVTSHAKKDDVVKLIEAHLKTLDTPLDTLEYPELSQYYSSLRGDESDNDADRSRLRIRVKTTSTDSDDNIIDVKTEDPDSSFLDENNSGAIEADVGGETVKTPMKKNYFNNLLFNINNSIENNKAAAFKFDLHERFTDVVNKTSEYNEKVQEYLADLETVYRFFILIEFIFLVMGIFGVVKDDFKSDRSKNMKDHSIEDFTPILEYDGILIILLTWAILYVGLPVLIGYYFNFARDIYMLSVDQMVYNLAKLLVIYIIHSKQLSLLGGANNNDSMNFVNKVIDKQPCLSKFSYYMKIMAGALGSMPLVFTLISSVLTIYVYILYMS